MPGKEENRLNCTQRKTLLVPSKRHWHVLAAQGSIIVSMVILSFLVILEIWRFYKVKVVLYRD